MERDIVKHRKIAVIRKADVLEIDFALDMRQLQCAGRVLQGRFGAHDLREALESRRAVGEKLGEVRELSDGVYKGRDVEAEHQKIRVIELIFHDEVAAHRDDCDGKKAHEQLHGAHENTHFAVEALFGDLECVVGAAELFALERFVRKGLRRAHAGKARLDVGVDVPNALLDLARGLPHLFAPQQNGRKEDRKNHADDKRQPPFGAEHDDERAGDRNERDEKVLRAVVGKLGDFKKVAREPAHELAGAVLVKVVEAELLHMAEESFSDVGLDADAECVAPVGDNVI